jgi:hypothetical protein
MSAAVQITTTEPRQPMTTTTTPAPAWDAGETMQRLAFCLDAAAAAGALNRSAASALELHWLGRLCRAQQLLDMHSHCSAATCGAMLADWAEAAA